MGIENEFMHRRFEKTYVMSRDRRRASFQDLSGPRPGSRLIADDGCRRIRVVDRPSSETRGRRCACLLRVLASSHQQPFPRGL